MRRTFALFAVALASLAAAAMAALLQPRKPAPPPPPPAVASGGGLRMQAALERLYPPRGRGRGRVARVFLASDGQANEGISDRSGLLRLARERFGNATLSTFGIGDDYDEDLMSALASQAGGRARYVDSPEILPGAFRAEL